MNDKDMVRMIRIIRRGQARELSLRSAAADYHDYHMNDKDMITIIMIII